jgi:hypothetical protein
MAYYSDDGRVQSVKVSELYRTVCDGGEEVSSEMAMKITPWIGRRYFSIKPPGSDRRMLYVPRQQLRDHWETDNTRELVLYVPANAMVRVTRAKEVVTVEEAKDYEMVDMRRDLVLMCHDNAQHPGLGRTLAAIRSVAYWSTMAGKEDRDSVQKHISMCAHCISVSEKAAEHGLGVDTVRRADVIQIDHFILEDDQKELAGCIGALSIVDVATRFAVYADAQGQTALETAVLLLIHWVPYFGIPVLIISDPHSGFASEVMAELQRIVGVKERELSAARAKGKVAIVERSHADLKWCIEDGFSKGGIRSLRDFQMHLSFAMQRRNHVAENGRIAPVELWSGQKVRTARQLAIATGEVEVPAGIGKEGKQFVELLKDLVGGMMEYERVMRDEVARKNALRRDKAAQKTTVIHYDFEEGEIVSHAGAKWKITELHGEVGRPVTATMVAVHGDKEKRARVDELAKLAAAMPVHMLPQVCEEGSFIMWYDKEDGCSSGGTIVEKEADELTVVRRQQNTKKDGEGGKSWLPTWRNEDGDVLVQKKRPEGFEANMTSLEVDQVELVGELTMTHRMTDATWRAAVARNIM